jgi:hypothetical protein
VEEHRLRIFEKRVLTRILGPMRFEIIGDWRKLHNEEFHNLYSSTNIITFINSRWMRWARHVANMKNSRNSYRVLVVKPDETTI